MKKWLNDITEHCKQINEQISNEDPNKQKSPKHNNYLINSRRTFLKVHTRTYMPRI